MSMYIVYIFTYDYYIILAHGTCKLRTYELMCFGAVKFKLNMFKFIDTKSKCSYLQ